MMNVLKNKFILFLMIFFVDAIAIADGIDISSTMKNVYSGATEQLGHVKKIVTDFFSDRIKHEEISSKKITIPQTVLLIQQIIDAKPSNKTVVHEYWQSKSSTILRCARILHEASTNQILRALQEIDKRLIYWLYQQEHQWQYFFGKNPLKWVVGKSQDVEIATNIELLQSKQDELYTRLGELSSIDWHEYLMAFNNYQASYAWVEKLFIILSGKKETSEQFVPSDDYGAIAIQLKNELKHVSSFKETILSSLVDTAVPHHIMRNWIKYGAFMVVSNMAYNSEVLAQLISSKALLGYQDSAKKYWQEELVPPVKNIVNKVFFRGTTDAERESLQKSLGMLLDKVAPQQKKTIMDAEKIGNLVPLQEFFNNMNKAGWRVASKGDVAQALSLFVQLKIIQGSDATSVLRNLFLLVPSYFVGLGGYYGYQRFSKHDYTPIRLALLAISSLFVDQTKPLTDLEYGKMIYFLYNLKEKARKELPVRGNVRDNFIKDLERVESREFDSAAKRRIIKDMFKKYAFLGMVQ